MGEHSTISSHTEITEDSYCAFALYSALMLALYPCKGAFLTTQWLMEKRWVVKYSAFISCILLTEICKNHTYAKTLWNVAIIKLFPKPFQKLKNGKKTPVVLYTVKISGKLRTHYYVLHYVWSRKSVTSKYNILNTNSHSF